MKLTKHVGKGDKTMENRIGVVEDDVNIQNIVSAYLKKKVMM